MGFLAKRHAETHLDLPLPSSTPGSVPVALIAYTSVELKHTPSVLVMQHLLRESRNTQQLHGVIVKRNEY